MGLSGLYLMIYGIGLAMTWVSENHKDKEYLNTLLAVIALIVIVVGVIVAMTLLALLLPIFILIIITIITLIIVETFKTLLIK
jgi:hypothetical protein